MNIEALNKVRGVLSFLGTRVQNINFNVNMEEQVQLAKIGQRPSYARLNWNCIGQAISEIAVPIEGLQATHFVGFLISTNYTLAVTPEDGQPIPENQEIPDEQTIATASISFYIDYAAQSNPIDLDQDAVGEFVQHNSPLHFWPYWRENLQNLAMRAQIVQPFLPPYIMQKEALPKQPD